MNPQLPKTIHERMMRTNGAYRRRYEQREAAQRQGRTLPPGECPKTSQTTEE